MNIPLAFSDAPFAEELRRLSVKCYSSSDSLRLLVMWCRPAPEHSHLPVPPHSLAEPPPPGLCHHHLSQSSPFSGIRGSRSELPAVPAMRGSLSAHPTDCHLWEPSRLQAMRYPP